MNKWTLLSPRILVPALAVLVLLNLVILIWIGAPSFFGDASPFSRAPLSDASAQIEIESPTPSLQPSPEPTHTIQPIEVAPVAAVSDPLLESGLLILAVRDGSFSHLFAYHPQHLPLTRLTDNAWDDIHPALSPDGSIVAFSSRRNGYWDLYMLNLLDGEILRVTDTPEYDGAPAWSPDGKWLVYESYQEGQFDLYIQSVQDLNTDPIRLTEDPGVDSMPHWSPDGRRIAFVSSRTGEEEIWIANLDQANDRFENISRSIDTIDGTPRWSPDGRTLVWASQKDGASTLMLWNQEDPSRPAVSAGSGDHPIWSPDGKILLAELRSPNQTALVGYNALTNSLHFPAAIMPGALYGMDWKVGALPDIFRRMPLSEYAALPAGPLWLSSISIDAPPPEGRHGVVTIEDVDAPYPYLHDAVDESFRALRDRTGLEAGWDLLSSLESAYFPLTEPPDPGIEANWMQTGRGFALNPMPLYAGWMVLFKEDFNGQTYWRIYLKTRYQDGSQGMPLTSPSWDMNARYTGGSRAYEDGGRVGSIPEGYWIDFTELAARYGWERLPALNNWRTFYPAARFNQFILTNDLDWHTAMREVYPQEALVTATSVPTPTPTITLTPRYKLRPTFTPTPTLTPTPTATIQPTWTPVQ
jgi:TolB protein